MRRNFFYITALAVAVLTASVFSQTATVPVAVNVDAAVSIQPASGTGGAGESKIVAPGTETVFTIQLSTTSVTHRGQNHVNPSAAISYQRGTVSLNLPVESYSNAHVSLFSVNGRRILRGKASAQSGGGAVSRSNIAEGVYLLSVTGEKGAAFTTKLVHAGGRLNINVAYSGGNRFLAKQAADYGIWTITATPTAGGGYRDTTYSFSPIEGQNPLQSIILRQDTGGDDNCGYRTSFCGGIAYASVTHNSTVMPSSGGCVFIAGFEQIEADLGVAGGSTVTINGVDFPCTGSTQADWDNCPVNATRGNIPEKIDGGYYVFVKTGSLNTYNGNGWRSVTAGTKRDCNAPAAKRFTVTFNTGGGTPATIPAVLVDSGTAIGSSLPTNVTKGDSTLAGWYSGNTQFTSSSVVIADVALTARYTMSSVTPGTCTPSGRSFTNVSYGTRARNQMDITLPSSGSGPWPVIVYIHGGGFTGGSKSVDAPLNTGPSRSGQRYATAAINYTLASGSSKAFPEGVEDALAAIRFLRVNAQTYCIDPNKIIVAGFSAGGYYAAMVAALAGASNHGFDNASLGNAVVSSKVQAAISCAALTDFTVLDQQQNSNTGVNYMFSHCGRNSPEGQLLGYDPCDASRAADVAKSNPLTYITASNCADLPPILMNHGSTDNLVPFQQSQMMVDKINQTCGASRAVYNQFTGGHSCPNDAARFFNFLDGIFAP